MIYVDATFEKTGNLQYISHLDLQRAVTRLLLRTQLPICYSEGFNPHPKLTFAQPLSIFQESLCERLEFRMQETPSQPLPSQQQTLEALQAVSPSDGLRFTAVRFSERKLPPCTAAAYTLTFQTALSEPEFCALFDGELTVLKKTKTQETLLDIAPLIRQKTVRECEGGFALSCVLSCGDRYLNPNYLAIAVQDSAKIRRILRTELFFGDEPKS